VKLKTKKEVYEAFLAGKKPLKAIKNQNGTGDLVASALWFISAIVSGLLGSFVFTLPGIIGGLYFLIHGLTKRGVITYVRGPKD